MRLTAARRPVRAVSKATTSTSPRLRNVDLGSSCMSSSRESASAPVLVVKTGAPGVLPSGLLAAEEHLLGASDDDGDDDAGGGPLDAVVLDELPEEAGLLVGGVGVLVHGVRLLLRRMRMCG